MNIGTALRAVILVVLLLATLTACGTAEPANEPGGAPLPRPTALPRAPMTPTSVPLPTAPAEPTAPPLSPQDQVNVLARRVVVALRDQHLDVVAQMVHEEKGLTFSPEAFIDATDLQFSPDEVAGLMDDATVYNWGSHVASGMPLEMSFAEYYLEYVFDKDYAAAPQVSVGQRLAGQGSMIDNTGEFWPGSMFVEYHYPGSAQYDGMDWTSLRLVFQEAEGTWFLVGAVHDEWSP